MNGGKSRTTAVAMTPSDGNPMGAGTSYGNNSDSLVATAAVDLIRQLDAAYSEMSSYICDGAREAEEARRNARVASELARRFSAPGACSRSVVTAELIGSEEGWWNKEEIMLTTTAPGHRSHQSPPPPPPPPPASSVDLNGWTPFSTSRQQQRRMTGGDTTPTDPPPSSSSARSNSNKRISKTAERLAAAHAEDLLQVSLELERTKQKLEAEQMRHDETKSALSQAKHKTAVMESQIERLLQDMETAREESGRKLDQLEDDLARAEHRIQSAENDAAVAIDICVKADQAKEEADRLLRRAEAQLNMLKEYIAQHHSAEDLQSYLNHGEQDEEDTSERTRQQRRVRFADDEGMPVSLDETPPPPPSAHNPESLAAVAAANRPSRALVAAGRQLLHRTFSSDGDGGGAFVVRHSTEASAARRDRLRNRLQALGVVGGAAADGFAVDASNSRDSNNDGDDREAPASSRPSRRNSKDLMSTIRAVEALDVCRNAAQILKESGRRLSLTGRWFNGQTTGTATDEIYLETLAKHYTTLVEVQLDRKHKEVLELESLVSLWEEGISVGRDAPTDA